MKKFRRMMALLLAMTMVLSMGITAFAAPKTNNKLTINGAKKGHTYTAYQVLSGELKTETVEGETTESLTGIQWGTGVSDAFKTAKGNAAEFAEKLTDEAAAKALAKELATGTGNLGTAAGSATATADGTVEITPLADGYYVII